VVKRTSGVGFNYRQGDRGPGGTGIRFGSLPLLTAPLVTARRAIVAAAIGGAVLLPVAACGPADPTPVGQPSAGATSAAPTGTALPTDTAAATAPPPAGTAGGTGGTGGTAGCHAADLSLKYLGSDGESGRSHNYYSLSNGSGHDCSLSGTPELRAVDGKGRTLLTAKGQTGTGQKIVLHPGKAAYTSTVIGDVPSDDANKAPCNPPAAALWLTPPGDTAHLTINGPWHICSNGELSATPFDSKPPANAHS
jgi:hypothetical protein